MRVATDGAVRQPEDMVEPWSHQPELLPSLALHLLVFLVGVSGHLSLLYYLHTRHIRSSHMLTSCDCLVELLVQAAQYQYRDVPGQPVGGGAAAAAALPPAGAHQGRGPHHCSSSRG